MLECMLESILRAYIRAYMAPSIQLCAIWSSVESMLRNVHENIFGGLPGNTLGGYLDTSRELTWEYKLKGT
jgi:hypothetical protein